MRTILVLSTFAALATAIPAFAQGESPRVKTTAEANTESLEGAAQAPLRDLNVVRTKVPPVLQDALNDPYKRPGARCADLVALLAPLNEALGADFDIPSADEDDLLDKGKDGALSAAATVASGALPFRGWLRKLSGADKHDRYVQAAITAGAVRRAYLKGLGEARGCSPPATPSHVLTHIAIQQAEEKAREDGGLPEKQERLKPRFPVRLAPDGS